MEPEKIERATTPLEVALEDVAESLRMSATTMADVMPSRPKARIIMAGLYVAAVSGVLVFGVVVTLVITLFVAVLPTQRASSRSLHILQDATGKASQKKAAQSTSQAVNAIILCDENHANRVVEVVLHMALSPLAGGCPVDQLP